MRTLENDMIRRNRDVQKISVHKMFVSRRPRQGQGREGEFLKIFSRELLQFPHI